MKGPMACTLCAEISGMAGPSHLYRSLRPSGTPDSRIFLETSSFVAMPSLGQIVDGYTILCSREHVPSIGASLLQSPITDLVEAIRLVRERIGRTYGTPVVMFEHGGGDRNPQLTCGVNHAHLHVIPSEVDFSDDERVARLAWRRCAVGDLRSFRDLSSGYLFYTDPRGEGFITTETDGVPSQFFRQVLADAVSKSREWNWREFPHLDRVAAAALLMRAPELPSD
jgi:ATP adenylyltransferase